MSTLERAKVALDLQNEKGVDKYGGTLDETKPSPAALVNHAVQEAADALMYLTRLADDIVDLQSALEEIAAGDGCYGAQAFKYKNIARKALGQPPVGGRPETSVSATEENGDA